MTGAATVRGDPTLDRAPSDVLLDIRDLRTYFHVMDGTVKAVDGVSFSVKRGQTLGVVGESGCGKSVTALTVMRLLDIPPAEITSGEILFKGRDLLTLPDSEMRKVRGEEIAMVFQEPMTSLNPVYTVGDQISEGVILHKGISKKAGLEKAIDSLRLVGINNPERRVKQYPHEMSGGMRQRVMIAMALSCDPDLIIADEPTTALDVTIQAQILRLLRQLVKERGVSVLFTTHDLGTAHEICDRVVVMYAGQEMESAPTDAFFERPAHPYTRRLLDSLPTAGGEIRDIPGEVPSLIGPPPGCRFHPRCDYATAECRARRPDVHTVEGAHRVRCYHPLSAA